MQINKYLLLSILFFNQIIIGGFDPNTLVQTPDGRQLISRLKYDDLVMCRKENQLQTGLVRNQQARREQVVWHVELGSETVRASANQRFYAVKSKQWKKAQDLVSGEKLLTINNEELLVQQAYEVHEELDLSEIEVENCHNFFASNKDVLVHNEPFTIGIGISIGFGAGAAEAACVTGTLMVAGMVGVKLATDSNNKGSLETQLNVEKISEKMFDAKSKEPAKAAESTSSEKDQKSDKSGSGKDPKKDDEEDKKVVVIPPVTSDSQKDQKSAGSGTAVKEAASKPAPQQAPNGKYADAPYHHANSKGVKSPAPKDGQKALDNSVHVKTKGNNDNQRRVAAVDGQFVVLDQTGKGEFHGHTRTWDEMTREMREKLIENGVVTKKGKIL